LNYENPCKILQQVGLVKIGSNTSVFKRESIGTEEANLRIY